MIIFRFLKWSCCIFPVHWPHRLEIPSIPKDFCYFIFPAVGGGVIHMMLIFFLFLKNLVLPFLFFLKTRFLAVTKYYRIEHYGGVWCTFQNCSIRTKPRISCTRTIFFQKFKIKKQKKNSSKWRRTRADIKSKISKFASYFQLGFTEGLDFFCFCWTKFLKIEKIQKRVAHL